MRCPSCRCNYCECVTPEASAALRLEISELEAENAALKKKLELAISGVEYIKKNELWGVVQNCDAVLKELRK